jgi:outer membrane murein-binding lipoprotein Lpp
MKREYLAISATLAVLVCVGCEPSQPNAQLATSIEDLSKKLQQTTTQINELRNSSAAIEMRITTFEGSDKWRDFMDEISGIAYLTPGAVLPETKRSREVTFTESFAAGGWTTVHVVLDGVPAVELGLVRVKELSHRGMSLRRG